VIELEKEQLIRDTKMNDDRRRAIASLRAIKDSLQYNLCDTETALVAEYHSVLDKLEKTGIDV
jgi:DNA-binding MarR family transcriptional regulator